MTIDWTPLADLIETHDRFLVTTHVRPDGDALGSEVGMAGLLRQKGKDVRVVNSSPTPPRYDFLDPNRSLFEHFQPNDASTKADKGSEATRDTLTSARDTALRSSVVGELACEANLLALNAAIEGARARPNDTEFVGDVRKLTDLVNTTAQQTGDLAKKSLAAAQNAESLLDWTGRVTRDQLSDREVAIILDLSSWNQLGDMAEFIRQFPGPRVIIDHHVSEDDLGATVFKDSTAEATGILVMQAIAALGGSYTPEVAAGLLTAIAMDTGWFRHSNTRASTLRAVAELIDAGARADDIYRKLFDRNTLGRLKLMGATLSGMQTDLGGKIAYATISLPDLVRTGAIPPDSEDLVDYTVSMRGVEIGMLFIEQARGGVKVSFRARNGLDVSRLAAQFGGGGHREAAGATVPGSMDETVERVLEVVRAVLGRGVS
jgi:bifunctional oligoribonuclease and PAP phosphatase NrnA